MSGFLAAALADAERAQRDAARAADWETLGGHREWDWATDSGIMRAVKA
jgi:hypothetical protein